MNEPYPTADLPELGSLPHSPLVAPATCQSQTCSVTRSCCSRCSSSHQVLM